MPGGGAEPPQGGASRGGGWFERALGRPESEGERAGPGSGIWGPKRERQELGQDRNPAHFPGKVLGTSQEILGLNLELDLEVVVFVKTADRCSRCVIALISPTF